MTPEVLVDALKAAGQPTRMRILALLRHSDLSVGELAQILDQSQPRLSHHLKTLMKAGLLERLPEGAWMFYRIQRRGAIARILQVLFHELKIDDDLIASDLQELQRVRKARAQKAKIYFSEIAGEWDRLRSLHYPEAAIECAIHDCIGSRRFERMIDFGTGTGRMLTLLAPHVQEAEGLDLSHSMLTVARANLNRAGVKNARVRHGDVLSTPFDDDSADLIIIHQVLHFLDKPRDVLAEASRILIPGGQLIIVDFTPHDLEFLRETRGHRRLGISEHDMTEWASAAGLILNPPRSFAPPASLEQGLNVNLWTASLPAQQLGGNNRTKLSVAEQQSTPAPKVSFEFFSSEDG